MTSKNVIDGLQAEGIRLPRGFTTGNQKTTCPKCSHSRRNKADPCLSVTISDDEAVWKCHHCGFSGGAGGRNKREEYRPQKKAYVKPEYKPNVLSNASTSFFTKRGISQAVLDRNRVGYNAERKTLMFPFYENGVVVNVKHRTHDKKFMLEKDAQLIFYGLDDIRDQEEIIIVEGEMDKLAVEVAGRTNVISVPNGAPPPGTMPNMEYLHHARHYLDRAKRIVLAVDNDAAGFALEAELSRRIGIGKCWRVRWGEGLKDANEALMAGGADLVLDALNDAQAMPLEGVRYVHQVEAELLDRYRNGVKGGESTGFENLDIFYKPRLGEFSVITGIPSHGKSEMLDAIMVNLAQLHGWKFVLFSPENPMTEHISKLTEKRVMKSFSTSRRDHMSEEEMIRGAVWVDKHFAFLQSDDEINLPTIEWILEEAKQAILRDGIHGLVIDPWNEIEHQRQHGENETDYVARVLQRIKRFARNHQVHVWVVAHPSKEVTSRQGKGDELPVPTLYDIAGSANFYNKMDCGLVVYRRAAKEDYEKPVTEVHIRKVRFKEVGHIGLAKFTWIPAYGGFKPADGEPGSPDYDQPRYSATEKKTKASEESEVY